MQNKLFIGNLSFDTTEQDLKEMFGSYGEITEIKVPTDRDTGRARGFAFLTFEKQSSAEKALELNSTTLNGRSIRVDIATEKSKSSGGGRGGYGDSRRRY